MTSYDSDSSFDDSNDKSTSVTLGYASVDSTGDDISHIGGRPSWLDSKSTPDASLARCKICASYMTLLLQLHADSQQHFPNDQRRLFVWCCRRKSCARKPGSVRSFREVKRGKQLKKNSSTRQTETKDMPTQNLGSQLFGSNASAMPDHKTNPFSTETSLSLNGNPFASTSSLGARTPQAVISESHTQVPTTSFAEKLKIGSSSEEKKHSSPPLSESWPESSVFPTPLPSFFLDAETEYLDPEPPGPSQKGFQSTIRSDDSVDSSHDAPERDSKDTFESDLDRTFQKFSDTVAQNPEQVLRYELKGQPLLYSSTDSVAPHFVLPNGRTGPVKGIPRCDSCGARRVFEMQLVPGLIYEVEKDDQAIGLDEGMEWGTIIVGTCEKNCGEEDTVVFKEEWVGVQWEERSTITKKT